MVVNSAMLLGSDAEAARSSLYRQVKKANKEASKKRRDEKKSNKSRLGQLDREISMIEKLLEKNVPTIDYTPEQNKKRLVKLKIERDNNIKKMSNPTIADCKRCLKRLAQKSKDARLAKVFRIAPK